MPINDAFHHPFIPKNTKKGNNTSTHDDSFFDTKILLANIPMVNNLELIGKGAYGRVYRVSVNTTQWSGGLAVKWSSRKSQGHFDSNYDDWLKKAQRELAIMKILSTTAINTQCDSDFFERTTVKLINVYLLKIPINENNNNSNETLMHMFQLTECFQQNLEQFLFELENPNSVVKISNQIVHFIFHEVCHGLYNLHSLGIIHRDLSDDNILVSWNFENPNKSRIVISDYGHARFLNETFSTKKSNATPEQIAQAYIKSFENRSSMEPSSVKFTAPNHVGKIHYRPPEGLSPYATDYYSMPWDIWQMGMVFLNVLCKTDHAWVRHMDVPMINGKMFASDQCEASMLKIIEEGFGPPSKQEIGDLMFYYPPSLNHEKYPNHHRKRQEANWKKISELEAQNRNFNQVKNLGQQQIDIYRYKYLMRIMDVDGSSERNVNFHNLAIVDEALKSFVLKLLRYSPLTRPSIATIVKDPFITNCSKWNTGNICEPNNYNIQTIPKLSLLESTPELADQMDIPAYQTLARMLNSKKAERKDIKQVFTSWFNQEFNSMFYIDVFKVFGDRMRDVQILLKVIKMLRMIIDRNQTVLNKSIEGEFNQYLKANKKEYPFLLVFVDSDPNSVRNWQVLSSQVESFLILQVQNNFIMFYAIKPEEY